MADGRVELAPILAAGRAVMDLVRGTGFERFVLVHGRDREVLLEAIGRGPRRGAGAREERSGTGSRNPARGCAGGIDPGKACLVGLILGDPHRKQAREQAERAAAAMGEVARRMDAGGWGAWPLGENALPALHLARPPEGDEVPLVAFAAGASREAGPTMDPPRGSTRISTAFRGETGLLLGFSALAQDVQASRDRAGILSIASRDLGTLVGADLSGVAEVEMARSALVVRHLHRRAGPRSPRAGRPERRPSRFALSRNHALGWAALNREALRLEDLEGLRGFVRLPGRAAVRAGIFAPLVARDRVEGVLFVAATRPGAFAGAEGEVFLQAARLVSIALENVILYEEVERLAKSDPLTGVANHRVLHEALHRETERCRRYRHPLSLLMMDLDDFKRWNDANGHPAGDRLLREVAGRLVAAVRRVDLVARYGGDEFAVVLPQIGVRGLRTVAERIRRSVGLCGAAEEGEARSSVTLSIGGATFPRHARDAEGLLQAADRALYRAKAEGGGAIHIAPAV